MRYAKAIVAAGIAGLSVLGTALADGHISAGEWVAVASATLAALGLVWGVPNAKPPPPLPLIATSTSGNVRVVPRDDTGGTVAPPD
ncbi:MAG TPA: hypothetical protein VF506_06420 [Streptosporangiaceae bacterium]